MFTRIENQTISHTKNKQWITILKRSINNQMWNLKTMWLKLKWTLSFEYNHTTKNLIKIVIKNKYLEYVDEYFGYNRTSSTIIREEKVCNERKNIITN